MRRSRSYEEVLEAFSGREPDFAVLFVDDVQNQLDLIPEDADELIELFCALKETPQGEAFLSLLLGISAERWLDENMKDLSVDDDE
jgi:hypothetical protein